MITPAIRVTCASAAVISFFLSLAAIVTSGAWTLPLALAAILALAAMFGRRASAAPEAVLEENYRRFRLAMRLCFSLALLSYSVAAALRRTPGALVQQAAILGVAFWLIAFVLAFFVVYFHAQLRLARSEPNAQ